jgi:hypothetical protein
MNRVFLCLCSSFPQDSFFIPRRHGSFHSIYFEFVDNMGGLSTIENGCFSTIVKNCGKVQNILYLKDIFFLISQWITG